MMQFVFYAFLFIFFIQCCYYLAIFSRFNFSKPSKKKSKPIPVSVLICARNEAENLKEFLPYFLNQEYPIFELVLINDGSYDETLEIMESFQEKHPKIIQIVNVLENDNFWGNKKYALTLGIKAAEYEHLLFSDADCKPVSKEWIAEMSQLFTEEKIIILGYGAYKKIKKSFLNKLIRFETLLTAIQYFSYAQIGIPYMGVGRNLAYSKKLFFKANGFAKHIHLKSGDDDLFVNQNATSHNVTISTLPNSFTISEPKTTFKSWITQKRRHVSTANNYKWIHKYLLGIFYSSQLLFWFLATLLLAFTFQWKVVLVIALLRLFIQYIIIGTSAKKLNEKDLIMWLPFLEIFLILIQLFIFIKNQISKPTHW